MRMGYLWCIGALRWEASGGVWSDLDDRWKSTSDPLLDSHHHLIMSRLASTSRLVLNPLLRPTHSHSLLHLRPSPRLAAFPSPRFASGSAPRRPTATQSQQNRSLLLYSAATIVLVTAASYLAVPLYRAFCSATGYAGTPRTDARFDAERLSPDQIGRAHV